MQQQLIYDLPTRLFHWFFAGLFLVSFVIAKTIDDDSPVFAYHSLSGLVLGFLVLLRIIWGVLGTHHARFSNFALNPVDLLSYFKGFLSGDKKRWAGHNPASSWAAIVMMAMAMGLGITGYLMASGPNKEDFEDLHELFANGFVVVAVLHVLGVILHTLRHHEMIALSMIHGRKQFVAAGEEIASSKNGVGVLLLGLLVVFSLHLYKNYDSQTGNLQFFGTSLEIGEGVEGTESQQKNSDEQQDDDEN